MEVEGNKFTNLLEEGTVTLGAPHPGLNVFQHDNAMQYFNKGKYLLKKHKDFYVTGYFPVWWHSGQDVRLQSARVKGSLPT